MSISLKSMINESNNEFVVFIEKDNGRKKLLHIKKSQRAANMFMQKNMDKILNTSGIHSIGTMSKDQWEQKEARFAENITKSSMKTVTKKEWDKTNKDYKGMIKGQPYMMWFDKKTQSTVYGPVQIKESVNESASRNSMENEAGKFIQLYKTHNDSIKENFIPKVGTIDDFNLKDLLLKNPKVLNILGKKELSFLKKPNTDVIMHQSKRFNKIVTDGKLEFEIDQKAQKLVKPLGKARKEIVNYYSTQESVNEAASRTAMEIGGLTGMNKDAIQKFVDTNKLDIEKVFQFVKKGKLKDRMDFVTALAGKDGNPIQKKMIKMFSESVNEGKADGGKMARTHVVYAMNILQSDNSYLPIRVSVKKGSDAEKRAIAVAKKNLGKKFKSVKAIGKALNPEKSEFTESVNEDTKKRFDVDFYKGNGDRQTSHEEIIRGDKFSDVVSQATKVAKSKGMNYVEFYHRDFFIGSIDKRNGYQFKKGRDSQKSPLSVNEAKFGYKTSTASYINKHKDEYKVAEKMNKGNEMKFYDDLQAMEDKIGHPKTMLFISNALRGYGIDMYKDPKIKNPADAQEALFLLSK